MRPDSGQSSGAVGGGERGESKIIDGGPEPETVFMNNITPHGDHDLILAGDVYVAGRVFWRARNLHMLTGKTAGKISDGHGADHLNVDGKSMRMENRRLYQRHGRHGRVRTQQFAQMRGDAALRSFQRAG